MERHADIVATLRACLLIVPYSPIHPSKVPLFWQVLNVLPLWPKVGVLWYGISGAFPTPEHQLVSYFHTYLIFLN